MWRASARCTCLCAGAARWESERGKRGGSCMTSKHGIVVLGLALGGAAMTHAETPASKVRAARPPAARAAARAAASKADILPFKAVERTLPNGLKVIVVPTGFPNLVSIQIPVQTGSRNEVEPGKSGFAHFFEH